MAKLKVFPTTAIKHVVVCVCLFIYLCLVSA